MRRSANNATFDTSYNKKNFYVLYFHLRLIKDI